MKVQVLHDEQGNIISFAVVRSGSTDGLSLVPKEGQSTKVVSLPSIKGKPSNEKTFKHLLETIRQHKVDVRSGKGVLVRKSVERKK
jgi:hypothetical protein